LRQFFAVGSGHDEAGFLNPFFWAPDGLSLSLSKGIPMVSSRASEVAELLWELKKAQKVATFSTLAKQAGFSAGMNGRTMVTTIRTIRRDWPHLEWWRAISDDGLLPKESEQETKLRQCGYELEEAKGKRGSVVIKSIEAHLMSWQQVAEAAAE
jgi:alkylated DNA nucleotide flippase Atl1